MHWSHSKIALLLIFASVVFALVILNTGQHASAGDETNNEQAKINWQSIKLEFNGRVSKVAEVPWPRELKDRRTFYYFTHEGKAFTFDDGIVSIVGQNESPPGGLTFRVALNDKGQWYAYRFTGKWPRGGLVVQAILNDE